MTVLVSAHPDDVALSVGGSILIGFFRRPILIVSVFTFGGTAMHYQGDRDDQSIFMLERTEDERFAEAVGSRLERLEFVDAALASKAGNYFAPLRWVSSIVRGPPPPNNLRIESELENLAARVPRVLRWLFLERVARFGTTYAALGNALSRILHEFPDASLASPLGLGLHPDHVMVATICKRLSRSRKRACFYEDLPYAAHYELSGIRRHVTCFDKSLHPLLIDVEGEMEQKIANLRLYDSQLDYEDIDPTIMHSKRLTPDRRSHERIWMRRPWMESWIGSRT